MVKFVRKVRQLTELPQRFWSKVNKNGPIIRPELGPCWTWTASTIGGYGSFRIGSYRDGTRKKVGAHRFMLEAKLGRPLQPGMETLHSCDYRACVNPDHLSEGTRAQNAQEAFLRKRGTNNQGSRHGMSKLTETDILVIRSDSRTQEVIAKSYGINQSHVSNIKRKKTWKHLVD